MIKKDYPNLNYGKTDYNKVSQRLEKENKHKEKLRKMRKNANAVIDGKEEKE